MIENKYISKIVAVLMAAAVALCLGITMLGETLVSAAGGLGVTMEYESRLFDTGKVLEVNILMEDAKWQSMLENAMREEYVQCDVEIEGETFYRVGIRPKGNTSLSNIAKESDAERYSLKLEFDRYVEGQTCYGLDKLILNNNYADATCMKEALIYDMFQEMDTDASLYNYAKISVNGEYRGLYLALEAVEDSFLLRNYGTENGELYKPENMNMGGGDREGMPDKGQQNLSHKQSSEDALILQDKQSSGDTAMPQDKQQPSGDTAMPQDKQSMGDAAISQDKQAPEAAAPSKQGEADDSDRRERRGDHGGGMSGGGGSNLNYSDDELESYSTIWKGEVTNTGEKDHKRVITALKNISQGTNLETYMEIENLINYMAVHIFSENEDSLSGAMAHNYYLYESGGKLNLLPWDYNLAFGGMGMGRNNGATDVVNGAIDEAWNGTDFFDSLLANETYQEAYYAAMERVVNYIQNGTFEAFYHQTRSQIDELVKNDPTAFYDYEEYQAAVETFYEVVTLRGQSIRGQLDGTIPSTEEAQRSSDALVDASHLDLSVMGSMSMGGGGFENRGARPEDRTQNSQGAQGTAQTKVLLTSTEGDAPEGFGGGMPPEGFGGEVPEGFAGEVPEGFEEGMPPEGFGGEAPEGFEEGVSSEGFGRGMPPEGFADEAPEEFRRGDSAASSEDSTLLLYGISSVVLLAAFLYALCYQRKPRKR